MQVEKNIRMKNTTELIHQYIKDSCQQHTTIPSEVSFGWQAGKKSGHQRKKNWTNDKMHPPCGELIDARIITKDAEIHDTHGPFYGQQVSDQ